MIRLRIEPLKPKGIPSDPLAMHTYEPFRGLVFFDEDGPVGRVIIEEYCAPMLDGEVVGPALWSPVEVIDE